MHKLSCKSPYTSEEWEKIKKLASGKGKIYKTAKAAKEHIRRTMAMAAVANMQGRSIEAGRDRISLDEINREIAGYRKSNSSSCRLRKI